jgi:pyruvate,orthophosphate dikinase
MTPRRESGFLARVSRAGRNIIGLAPAPLRVAETVRDGGDQRAPRTAGVPVVDVPVHGFPIYGFDDAPDVPAGELRRLLGGKGAGLVEMRRLGVPVPAGFVLGTGLCQRFLASDWPEGLDEAIEAKLDALQGTVGQRLGDAQTPSLVSVRSGAPVSMPGMMDTILNLGANRATIEALAARTNDERFALDTWSRFSRMYASTVLGISADMLGAAPASDASAATLRTDVDKVHGVCARLKTPIPDDPRAQLRGAIAAVFRSSRSARARVFCEREGLAPDIPTAVVVQAMVFGNLGASSGTGVAFSRNPSTGANEPYGDFLINAQGEAVVSGSRMSAPLATMQQHVPKAFDELGRIMQTLERHYRDLCDIEFTVQEGRLHILQVRIGKRSAIAAARMAVEMAGEGLITREDAVRRLSGEQLGQLQSIGKVRAGAAAIASGVAASPGVASGVICLDPDRAAVLALSGQNVILVRPTTSPEDVHGMVKSVGIVTSSGGMVSHAALVARGWGIAAVCGVDSLAFEPRLKIGGVELGEGDQLTIDGGSGAIYLGDCVEAGCEEPPELQTLRRWSSELGIELGGDARALDGSVDTATRDAEICTADAFAVMRALALLGMAGEERLAASLATTAEAVRSLIEALMGGHLNRTPRGLQITVEGRAWLHAQLDAERACTDRAAVDRLYRSFMVLDDRFKRLLAAWQMRTLDGREVRNDHADAAYDAAIRERLGVFHGEAAPLIDDICVIASRLQPYRLRFARASAAVAAGDGSMIASPLKDSYHSVWFELHEELMHLSGRSRAVEETKASERGTA